MRSSICLAALIPLAAAAAAQDGYDWDHPDGLGVRYLLYNRMQPAKIKAKDHPPELRASFLPKSQTDWVRFKGTALAWGVYVYEFPAAGDGGGFAGFLAERDPRRAHRDFKSKPGQANGGGGHWEFVDTWRPFVEVLDRPQPGGADRWAVAPELGVRFLVDKGMQFLDPLATVDGANCYARLHPEPKQWIRIRGLPGPAAWTLRLFVFPAIERQVTRDDMKKPVESFAELVDKADTYRVAHQRTFTVRDQPAGQDGAGYRLWRWLDARRPGTGQGLPFYHCVAAVHAVGGREVALVALVPSEEEKPPVELLTRMEKMATSLEPWAGQATEPGFAYYSVAQSCRVGDKEVAVVVYVPFGANPKPDAELLSAARKMVKSLQPVPAGKAK
jgi:hypothetical protein